MTIEIHLPWPSKYLSPNARGHWAELSRVKKQAHHDGYWAAKAADDGAIVWTAISNWKIPVKLTFCPPNKRRRDLDNAQASMKHQLDGIAQAMGVDDSRFRPVSDWGEVVKGGKVIVEVGV